MRRSFKNMVLTGKGRPAGVIRGVEGEIDGGEGGTNSNGRACSGVPGVLQGGDRGADRSWGSRLYLGRITPETVGTMGFSLICAVCLRGMLTLESPGEIFQGGDFLAGVKQVYCRSDGGAKPAHRRKPGLIPRGVALLFGGTLPTRTEHCHLPADDGAAAMAYRGVSYHS